MIFSLRHMALGSHQITRWEYKFSIPLSFFPLFLDFQFFLIVIFRRDVTRHLAHSLYPLFLDHLIKVSHENLMCFWLRIKQTLWNFSPSLTYLIIFKFHQFSVLINIFSELRVFNYNLWIIMLFVFTCYHVVRLFAISPVNGRNIFSVKYFFSYAL